MGQLYHDGCYDAACTAKLDSNSNFGRRSNFRIYRQQRIPCMGIVKPFHNCSDIGDFNAHR